MKKFLLLVLILTLTMSIFLVGCGSSNQPADTNQLKVAMVTDVGGVHDQSFNQSAWEGLEKAQIDLGVKGSYLESKQDADYAPNIETLLDAGNDLIWGIGFKMGDTILQEAKNNPDQKYAIIDYAYADTPKNLVGVVFKAEQSSFLVGYIAGKMTKTGTVGFVGGIEGNVIDAFDYGYQAGVKYANPDVKILRQYAESFTDSAKGKAIANQMYQDGADIVFHAAGGVGDGVIEAAKEQGKYAIGVDRDQNSLAPDNVITSAMKRVDNGIYNITKMLKEGNFPGGTTVVLGLKEGGVDIAPSSSKHVPKDILDEVAKLKQQIMDGKIVVPYNKDTFDKFEMK